MISRAGLWKISKCQYTQAHAYKFERDADGKVNMFFKRFAMDDTWMKSDLRLLSHMPIGQSAVVPW